MNLKKIPKEKQKQLLLVVIITLAILGGLGFGLVKEQSKNIKRLQHKTEGAKEELRRVQNAIKHAAETQLEVTNARTVLEAAETDVATGDLYAWFVNTLRGFKAAYKVEIPRLNPVGQPVDVNFLAEVPYKQVVIPIAGTAHFQEFGRFLADLENRYPHFRVVNLNLEPSPAPGPGEDELLGFKFDLAALVKPNSP
jgi:hypothetical protein